MFHLVAILATIGIFTAYRSKKLFSLPRAEDSEASTDDQYTLLALSPVPQIRPTIVYSVCVCCCDNIFREIAMFFISMDDNKQGSCLIGAWLLF